MPHTTSSKGNGKEKNEKETFHSKNLKNDQIELGPQFLNALLKLRNRIKCWVTRHGEDILEHILNLKFEKWSRLVRLTNIMIHVWFQLQFWIRKKNQIRSWLRCVFKFLLLILKCLWLNMKHSVQSLSAYSLLFILNSTSQCSVSAGVGGKYSRINNVS